MPVLSAIIFFNDNEGRSRMLLTQNSYTRVTLALDIVRKMPDGLYKGYHELGTVKHRIDLCDVVSVEDAQADSVECDDPAVPRDGRNSCLKAAGLLRKESGLDRHARITIKKRIPVMGGLAGGSANAAATIALLNELWGLRLTLAELIALGRAVGMDVPYYFIGGTAFDSEAGGRLEPITTPCSFVFVLACPEFGVSTKEAYAGVDYGAVGRACNRTSGLRGALESGEPDKAVTLFHNDFELPVFALFPRCAALKKELLDAGCRAAVLTGSGSTVIGVARDLAHAAAVQKSISCRTIISSTLQRNKR
jgi:4-diphosphocytidyl-2-C-methyl-D-erythritol kinase